MKQSRIPRHQTTPVVSHKIKFRFAKCSRNSRDVVTQVADVICVDVVGLTAFAIPALVRHCHAVTCSDQGINLVAPQIPPLRPAVGKNDQRPLTLRTVVEGEGPLVSINSKFRSLSIAVSFDVISFKPLR